MMSIVVANRVMSMAVVTVLLAASCRGSSVGPEVSGVRELWYQTQPGYGRARPAVSGELAYFGAGDGEIIARQLSSGAPVWATKISNDAIKGASIVVRGGVVVASSVFQTAALDATTGQQLWRYEAPDDTTGALPGNWNPGSVVDSRIEADDQAVYVPAWGASIGAVDLRTGVARWTWRPHPLASDTAASGTFRSGSMGVKLSGDTLFATLWHFTNRNGGTSEALVVALDKRTGDELWTIVLPDNGSGVLIQSAPAVSDNLVIVNTISAKTYAIDRTTKKVIWTFSANNPFLSTLAGATVFENTVYVDGGDGKLYALRAADGTVVWSAAYGTATTHDLLVTSRHVLFPTGAELHIVDRQNGNQILAIVQPHTTDPLFASAAEIANGFVLTTVGGAAWCFQEP